MSPINEPYILTVEQAVEVLRSGGVIALPTDTVYGVAASLEHPAAVERLFSIKGRDAAKAIPLLVSEPAMLATLATHVRERANVLAERLWPGALTLVVTASANVPVVVRRGLPTVGVRMPDSTIALEIIRVAGGVLAVTSANPSGEPETRSAGEVRTRLGDRIDGVVDGGPSPKDRPSTVVDVSGDEICILRHGAVSEERIREILREAGQV